MADTYEQNLGQKSSLTTTDFIRVVGSDNVSYKQPLTALGSGMLPYLQYKSSVDANDFQTPGVYYLTSNCTNMPAGYMFLAIYRGHGANDILQHAFSLAGEVYARRRDSSGTWYSWQKMPTRAEIDALNSKTNFVITGSNGHTSEATITAVRNYFDNNAPIGMSIGVINSGDYGGAIIIKASANVGIVFRLSYTNATSKGSIKSMTKINTWGDWVYVV